MKRDAVVAFFVVFMSEDALHARVDALAFYLRTVVRHV